MVYKMIVNQLSIEVKRSAPYSHIESPACTSSIGFLCLALSFIDAARKDSSKVERNISKLYHVWFARYFACKQLHSIVALPIYYEASQRKY